MWFNPSEVSKINIEIPAIPATPANWEDEKPKVTPQNSKIAGIAGIAVDTGLETIKVICYTPLGNPLEVIARDFEHAEFLRRMNPMIHHQN